MAKANKLDKKDVIILNMLQENARTSNVDIAKKLKMAPSAILERLRKLEKRGFINGHHTVIKPDMVNLPLVTFILIQTHSPNFDLESEKKIIEIPYVQELHRIPGRDESYLAKVRSKDTNHLSQILIEELAPIADIYKTKSILTLQTLKETSYLPLDKKDT